MEILQLLSLKSFVHFSWLLWAIYHSKITFRSEVICWIIVTSLSQENQESFFFVAFNMAPWPCVIIDKDLLNNFSKNSFHSFSVTFTSSRSLKSNFYRLVLKESIFGFLSSRISISRFFEGKFPSVMSFLFIDMNFCFDCGTVKTKFECFNLLNEQYERLKFWKDHLIFNLNQRNTNF